MLLIPNVSNLQARKEKSKQIYVVRKNLEFDNAEVLLYEPVEKMPPFSRKTLVFVGLPNIPKQTLVHKLVDSNPDMFGRPIPCKLISVANFPIFLLTNFFKSWQH